MGKVLYKEEVLNFEMLVELLSLFMDMEPPNFRIGKVRIEKPILAADIEDDALLGKDILKDKNGKVEILFGEYIIKLFGHEIGEKFYQLIILK